MLYEDILKGAKCMNTRFDGVEPNLVCCRRKPVGLTTAQPPNPRKPTKKPSQRPQSSIHGSSKTSTKMPKRNPSSKPTTQVPSLTSTQIPVTTPPTQPLSTQPQDAQKAAPSNNDCNCMPLSDCHDEDFEQKQENCTNPSEVCSLGLVKPVTSSQPQPPKSPQTPTHSTQDQTVGTSPRPQPPSPIQASPPGDKTCTCTPFYKCYDEETSSNLTGLVNDRVAKSNNDESCSDPNDMCCYNLVPITPKPIIDSSENPECTGSCIFITQCPYFVNKLKEAQDGNSEAIQELRKAVSSRMDDGRLLVCCSRKARNNTSGVIWPDK